MFSDIFVGLTFGRHDFVFWAKIRIAWTPRCFLTIGWKNTSFWVARGSETLSKPLDQAFWVKVYRSVIICEDADRLVPTMFSDTLVYFGTKQTHFWGAQAPQTLSKSLDPAFGMIFHRLLTKSAWFLKLSKIILDFVSTSRGTPVYNWLVEHTPV